MGNIAQEIEQRGAKLGGAWTEVLSGMALLDKITRGEVRLVGMDNALLVEIDGATWTLPDAYRLNSFR